MTTTCACGKPTPQHAYLCHDCTTDLRNTLGRIPSLATDLDLTMSKQRRFGEANTGSRATTTDHGLPFNIAAAACIQELRHELLALVLASLGAGLTAPHQPTPPHADQPGHSLPGMARWLLWRVNAITGQPWATTTERLVHLAARADHVIDAPAERLFAGPCDTCGTDLYAKAGKPTVTCPHCDLTYDLVARRRWLLTLVDDRLATATEVARALTSLDLPVTPERIRQWKHRDRLAPAAHDRLQRPLYRVGDVVDLVVQQAERLGA